MMQTTMFDDATNHADSVGDLVSDIDTTFPQMNASERDVLLHATAAVMLKRQPARLSDFDLAQQKTIRQAQQIVSRLRKSGLTGTG